MVSVLIVVAPLTSNVVKPVTISVVSSPNTASPTTFRLWLAPLKVPFVVTVLPVSVVLPPNESASL